MGKVGYSREAAPNLPVIRFLSLAASPALSTASTFVSASYWVRGRCHVQIRKRSCLWVPTAVFHGPASSVLHSHIALLRCWLLWAGHHGQGTPRFGPEILWLQIHPRPDKGPILTQKYKNSFLCRLYPGLHSLRIYSQGGSPSTKSPGPAKFRLTKSINHRSWKAA